MAVVKEAVKFPLLYVTKTEKPGKSNDTHICSHKFG